ncbi:hypothetical protein EDB89DRAFT_1953507 [Lactarius sanguifluus]|nr:hypothetical protein EDB89DRAFT_1953507 [Lactarius sanguifluus]
MESRRVPSHEKEGFSSISSLRNRHSMMRGWKLRSAGASESIHPSVVGVCLCIVATRLVRGTVAPPWTIWIKTLQEPLKDPLILFAHSTMSYHSNQYGTQQTGAQNVPQQQQRQSSSQPRYQTSTSAQVSSRSEYPEQSGTTSPISPNNRTDVLIPKSPYTPHITTGPLKLSRRTSTLTAPAMGTLLSHWQSRIRLPPAVLTSNAAPLGSQQLNTPPPAVPSNAAPPDNRVITLPPAVPSNATTPDSLQRFTPPQAPATHYPPASSAVQHNYTGQSTAYYPPTQAFDSTNTSYPGSQPAPTSHYGVPHGHGTNASDGSRSSNHLYQTAAPVTHGTLEPPYRGAQPSQERGVAPSQPYRQDAYEYDNVDEHRPKGPSAPPVQGPHHICRLPECNRPMFFDRRVSDFWEWCSPRHIYAGLERRIEKVCRHCEVWPRKYGHKYCGGPSCNKNGVPIPSN